MAPFFMWRSCGESRRNWAFQNWVLTAPGYRCSMLPETSLDALILKAIQIYNLTHSPQTKATFIQLAPPLLVVQFSGILCFECSTLNITEGFANQLKSLSSGKTELKQGKTTQTNPHTIQTTYMVKTK